MPTSISPDLKAGARVSVSGYSRSPLALSFIIERLCLVEVGRGAALVQARRLQDPLSSRATMPILPFHFGSSRSLIVCGGCFTVSGLYTSTCAL